MDRSKLEQTHGEVWVNRSIALDGLPYAEYLKSTEWARIKRKAMTRPHYQYCFVCKREDLPLEIHHRTYKWIGTERAMSGLVALCREHHQFIHDLAKEHNLPVRKATKKARKIYKRNAKK